MRAFARVMRVALVHDWLTGMRGGEKCLEALLDIFPQADIFTLLHVQGSVSTKIESRPIFTSFVQRLPRAPANYRFYLPLFPRAIEGFDLRGYHLIISISHAVAKGVTRPPGVPHLCYCLTPMRYIWDMYDAYFGPGRAGPAVRAVMPLVARRLRRWDRQTEGVDRFVAISDHVRSRVQRWYGRPADVVYPPVAIDRFTPAERRDTFCLIVSALVPYKRIDLAILAFNRLRLPLIVVGEGPERARLARLAGPTVRFTGWLSDADVAAYYARCRALIFPGEEDFGIAAVEAQAAGAPVVAFGLGGVTESVTDWSNGDRGTNDNGSAPTGVFFHEASVEALETAVRRLDGMVFDPRVLRASAARFGVDRFRAEVRQQVDHLLGGVAQRG